ncbi:hypothetical protein Mal64_35130 [Pseudobythopirellula maris]|uniref:Uncharacterized protein n=1 Tax=Pseudobythopirellula maris TaxID=2527991 RepID=A0A5C5ZH79_9BACT|nr:hypothetical protein Mal64_35130 [Pseudobythopirellula maris]
MRERLTSRLERLQQQLDRERGQTEGGALVCVYTASEGLEKAQERMPGAIYFLPDNGRDDNPSAEVSC